MMSQLKFIEKAVRHMEKAYRIPRGWWGTYTEATNGIARVVFSRRAWFVYRSKSDGLRWTLISKHDSREHAFRKARTIITAETSK